jgi:hypothetical protein
VREKERENPLVAEEIEATDPSRPPSRELLTAGSARWSVRYSHCRAVPAVVSAAVVVESPHAPAPTGGDPLARVGMEPVGGCMRLSAVRICTCPSARRAT